MEWMWWGWEKWYKKGVGDKLMSIFPLLLLLFLRVCGGWAVGCSKSSTLIDLSHSMCQSVGLRSDMPSICLHTCCECLEDDQFHHLIRDKVGVCICLSLLKCVCDAINPPQHPHIHMPIHQTQPTKFIYEFYFFFFFSFLLFLWIGLVDACTHNFSQKKKKKKGKRKVWSNKISLIWEMVWV